MSKYTDFLENYFMNKHTDFFKRTLKAKKCKQCTNGILNPTYCRCGLRFYKILTQDYSIKNCKQYRKINISNQDF